MDPTHVFSLHDPFLVVYLKDIKDLIVANQEKLTDLATRLTAAVEKINSGVSGIRTDVTALKDEIAALKEASEAGEALDFSGADAAVGQLEDSVAAIGALDAENAQEDPQAAPKGKAPASSGRGKAKGNGKK